MAAGVRVVDVIGVAHAFERGLGLVVHPAGDCAAHWQHTRNPLAFEALKTTEYLLRWGGPALPSGHTPDGIMGVITILRFWSSTHGAILSDTLRTLNSLRNVAGMGPDLLAEIF